MKETSVTCKTSHEDEKKVEGISEKKQSSVEVVDDRPAKLPTLE